MLSYFVTGVPLHHLNKTVSTSVIDFLAVYEDPMVNSCILFSHDFLVYDVSPDLLVKILRSML